MGLFKKGELNIPARDHLLQQQALDRFPKPRHLLACLIDCHNEHARLRHSEMTDEHGMAEYHRLDSFPVRMPLEMVITDIIWNPDSQFPEYVVMYEFQYDGQHIAAYGFKRDGSYSMFYN